MKWRQFLANLLKTYNKDNKGIFIVSYIINPVSVATFYSLCGLRGAYYQLLVDKHAGTLFAGPEKLLGGFGAGEGLLRWLENAEGRQETTDGLWLCWWEAADQCAEKEHHPTERTSGIMQ